MGQLLEQALDDVGRNKMHIMAVLKERKVFWTLQSWTKSFLLQMRACIKLLAKGWWTSPISYPPCSQDLLQWVLLVYQYQKYTCLAIILDLSPWSERFFQIQESSWMWTPFLAPNQATLHSVDSKLGERCNPWCVQNRTQRHGRIADGNGWKWNKNKTAWPHDVTHDLCRFLRTILFAFLLD